MRSDRRSLLAGLAGITAFPVLARPGAGWVAVRRGRGGRIFVPAVIAGRQVEALLDSAAEMSLVDKGFAQILGLVGGAAGTARGSGAGTQAVEELAAVPLAAAGVDLGPRSVAAIDLVDVSRRLIGEPVLLIVGRDLFDAARLEIDLVHNRLRVIGADATPKGERLPLTTAHGVETFPIRIGSVPVMAEFDLGNGSAMLVGAACARRLGLQPTGETEGGGIGGAKRMKTVVLPEVTIAGRRFANVPATIHDNDNAADANVGVAQLAGFRITTDFAGRCLWLR